MRERLIVERHLSDNTDQHMSLFFVTSLLIPYNTEILHERVNHLIADSLNPVDRDMKIANLQSVIKEIQTESVPGALDWFNWFVVSILIYYSNVEMYCGYVQNIHVKSAALVNVSSYRKWKV